MSYTLKYTGAEIDDILDRAVEGGTIDDALALKAPLASPALTGSPTAPTQPEEDNSTKVATTEYADRAADAAGAAAEAAAKEYTDEATSALYITDTASGSIASFSDGANGIPMRSVKAQIEPIQDLHGYDSPWPAGGGLNKLPPLSTQTKTGITLTSNNGQYTISGTATAATEFEIPISGLSLGSYTLSVLNTTADSTASISMQVIGANSTVLANGYLNSANRRLTIDASSEAIASVKIVIGNGRSLANFTLSPVLLSGTGYATEFSPYSNECPISGWTGAEVTRTGVNVWDEETELGGFDADGNKTYVTNQLRTKNPIMVMAGESYYASHATRYRFYDRNNVQFSSTLISAGGVITVPEGTAYMLFGLGTGYGTTYNHDISINYPSSDHDYHAYAGQTYPVTGESQAGTVYGGYFVVNEDGSVDLTVTHRSDTVSDEAAYGRNSGTNYYLRNAYLSAIPRYEQGVVTVSSDRFIAASASGAGRCFVNSSNNIRFNTTGEYDSVAAMLSAIGIPQFVYELAAPTTYHLASIGQITSRLGQNNVWSNTAGDTEVTYVADPKLYIAKITGGGALTLGSVSPLSVNRPVTISEEDLEQAGEVSEAVEAAAETVLPAESGETEEEAQE